MTFSLAVAARRFGLVATDSPRAANVARLRGGWATTCGQFSVTRDMLQAFGDLPAAATETMAALVLAIGADCRRQHPDVAQVALASIMTVYHDDGGFHAAGF